MKTKSQEPLLYFRNQVKNTRKKDSQARVSFLLAYEAGLRLSEITGLKPSNIKEKWVEIWGRGGQNKTCPSLH